MKKGIDYKALDELCRQNIECYDEQVRITWGYMDRLRMPMQMVSPLYDEIEQVLEDNEIDTADIDFVKIISI